MARRVRSRIGEDAGVINDRECAPIGSANSERQVLAQENAGLSSRPTPSGARGSRTRSTWCSTSRRFHRCRCRGTWRSTLPDPIGARHPIPRHTSCRHALVFPPGMDSPIAIRMYDPARRFVPRRISYPIPADITVSGRRRRACGAPRRFRAPRTTCRRRPPASVGGSRGIINRR